MSRAEHYIYDAEQSRAMDERARRGIPIGGFELMGRAADTARDVVLERFPNARRVRIWCGKGNNAGDGYLLAALLAPFGVRAEVIAVADPGTLNGDAARALEAARAADVAIHAFDSTASGGSAVPDLHVDALLGTGFRGALRPEYARAVAAMNDCAAPVLAIDVPSGVNAGTGAAAEGAVRAQCTVTFIVRKVGLETGPGRRHAGEVVFAPLSVPDRLYERGTAERLLWRQTLGRLESDAYKHRLGHVVVIGGDHGMPGAVALSAHAALRAGAGLVSLATRAAHAGAVIARTPEVMVFDADDENVLAARLDAADVVALGPGLGRAAWGGHLFERVQRAHKPVVLDADGLYWLAGAGSWQGGPLCITPHTGEAVRLLSDGSTASDVEADRIAAARALRERYGAGVVLKGPGSVLSLSDGEHICAHGNPGMASAGMGDVLTGIAAGLMAEPARAGGAVAALHTRFAMAVALHSAAGDHAAARVGQRSLMATDVIAALPDLLRDDAE